MFSKPIIKGFQLVLKVHEQQAPGLFTGTFFNTSWRHKAIGETLKVIGDPIKHGNLAAQAKNNLISWEKNREDAPPEVTVVHGDCLDVTAKETKKHGIAYAVLNNANGIYPGGAFLSGGSAQEKRCLSEAIVPYLCWAIMFS